MIHRLRWSALWVHSAVRSARFLPVRRAASDNQDIRGKWFCRASWWLIPHTRGAAAELRRARQVLRLRSRFKVCPSADPRRPNEIFREIERLDRELHREKTGVYNAQPRWSLSDIQIGSSNEALQVLGEFLRSVRVTAAEFCWTMNRPVRGMDWKQHAWKHTTFAEIETIVADVNSGRWLPWN